MTDYELNRAFADSFIGHQKEICSQWLSMPIADVTSHRDDVAGNGDIELRYQRHVIACRVRDNRYAERYQHEVTIRTKSNGRAGSTEADKLFRRDNPITAMLYGFGGSRQMSRWILMDATYLRAQLACGGELNRGHRWLTREIENRSDGGATGFQAIRFGSMTKQERAAAVIASSPGYLDECPSWIPVRQPCGGPGWCFAHLDAASMTRVQGDTAMFACRRCGQWTRTAIASAIPGWKGAA